jgi:hypothetical protein
MTWTEIEDDFGPLVEIPPLPNGEWDAAAIHEARIANRLWTRVDPGLVSTGLHYVNHECYFNAAKPHPADVDICEVDEDIGECTRCGDYTWNSPDSLCTVCVLYKMAPFFSKLCHP